MASKPQPKSTKKVVYGPKQPGTNTAQYKVTYGNYDGLQAAQKKLAAARKSGNQKAIQTASLAVIDAAKGDQYQVYSSLKQWNYDNRNTKFTAPPAPPAKKRDFIQKATDKVRTALTPKSIKLPDTLQAKKRPALKSYQTNYIISPRQGTLNPAGNTQQRKKVNKILNTFRSKTATTRKSSKRA